VSFQVRIEVTSPIATVFLVRPEPRQRVRPSHGWRSLAAAFDGLSDRADVRCVVVCGSGGPVFSEGPGGGTDLERGGVSSVGQSHVEPVDRALRAIQRCKQPTVAVVEGACAGVGLRIAASCDLRVCGESSRFGPAPRNAASTEPAERQAPLVRLLGPSPAFQVLLGGDVIDAEQALRAGLVNRIYADGSVSEQGYGLAARIAAGAPLVNRWHKRFVRRLLDTTPVSEEERRGAGGALTLVD
jgi:enoyl-CoA hydratase/carnithine racemase